VKRQTLGVIIIKKNKEARPGNIVSDIANLESVLKTGADGDEVLRRIKLAEYTFNMIS